MPEAFSQFFSGLPGEVYVFIISMLPIVELRGSIPTGAAIGLPFYLNYSISVFGNMLPVPLILLFIPRVLVFLEKFKFTRPVALWIKERADKKKARVPVDGVENARGFYTMSKKAFFALALFVAIPLPGTGAWMGSLVASLLRLPKRESYLAVLIGVMLSGIVMSLASYGVVGFLKIFI